MKRALENDLSLSISEKNREHILAMFNIAKTIQLPVLENGDIVGILDLFDYLKAPEQPINKLMETDFVVAGRTISVFSFQNQNQLILPFVDSKGRYVGFVNALMQKCYLPSNEYLQVIEESLEHIADKKGRVNIEEIGNRFNSILEANYDGIYVTVGKGTTLSINQNSHLVENMHAGAVERDEDISVELQGHMAENMVNVVQNVQKRSEVSVMNAENTNSGIVRMVSNLKEFRDLKEELKESKELIDKYEEELSFMRGNELHNGEIVAVSPAMQEVLQLALKIARVDSTVLIQGESGTGKEVISKLIQTHGHRADAPFIKIDCGAIPENLIESELFGYESGAFTGAEKGGRRGLVELANKGTLFLDEIGEMPLSLQAKLLRMLQEREFMRVGGSTLIKVDVRIIAATNRNLEEMVKEGKFRKDLYYRLNVVPIKIPPLSQRKADVEVLIEKCIDRFNKAYQSDVKLTPRAQEYLMDYNWPGNVRELENIMEYLVVTSRSGWIEADDLPNTVLASQNASTGAINLSTVNSLKEAVATLEERLLRDARNRTGSMEEMGRLLKIDRTTVMRKMKKYNIEY